jgi:hypothetical protein
MNLEFDKFPKFPKLTPDYPKFIGSHRGHGFSIELCDDYDMDETGNMLYFLRGSSSIHYIEPIVKLKRIPGKFFRKLVHVETQEEMFIRAVKREMSRIDRDIKTTENHKTAFNKLIDA